MKYQRKQEKTIKWDYIEILPTFDLVYKLFKYDRDDNNAFLESTDNVLSESTKKHPPYDENLKVTIQSYVR